MSAVPALYQGQQFIRTANADKKNKAANYLSFDINVAATVYSAYGAGVEYLTIDAKRIPG